MWTLYNETQFVLEIEGCVVNIFRLVLPDKPLNWESKINVRNIQKLILDIENEHELPDLHFC